MKLSIIIVSWNVKDLLERCLRSIAEYASEVSHEVIVIDNASADGSMAMVRQNFPAVKLIANTENRGFAAACNQGISESKGEYVFFLNPDSEITGGCVLELTRYLDSHHDVGVVAPQIRNDDGSIQHSVRRFPTPLSQFIILLKIGKLFPRLLRRYYAEDFDYAEDEQEVEQPKGAAFVVRSSVLSRVGFFDEQFFLWFDEIDLCKRIHDAGYKIVYLSLAHVIHHSGKSFVQKGVLEKQRIFFTSCALYLKKHCGFSGQIFTFIMHGFVGLFALIGAIKLVLVKLVSGPISDQDQMPFLPKPTKSDITPIFFYSLAAIICLELLSFAAYFYSSIGAIALGILTAGTFLLTTRRLEYGVAVLFAELIIGSKGYLFSMVLGGMTVSARMLLFGACIAGWILKLLYDSQTQERRRTYLTFRQSSLFRYYLILVAFIIVGVISAVVNGNSPGFIFADANAWLFFLVLPALYDALQKRGQIYRFLTVCAAALSAQILKVFVIFYIMGHRGFGEDFLTAVYRWIRSTGAGELTQLDSLYRIFFQSQIYIVIFFFILLAFIVSRLFRNHESSSRHFERSEESRWYRRFTLGFLARRLGMTFFEQSVLFFFVVSIASLILSFSRSFWLGAGVMLAIFSVGVFVHFRREARFAFRYAIVLAGSGVCALLLLFAISAFPFPSREGVFSIDLLSSRVEDIQNEAAAASRWNLLPIIASEIQKNPIMGFGFGKTLTYTSKDPRILLQNPSGEYTTYAFEWGYLDIWLKLGLFGLLSYVLLLFAIIARGADALRKLNQNDSIIDAALLRGLLFGIGALMIIHFFTPYLNHPLGIGIVILTGILSERLRHSERSPVTPSAEIKAPSQRRLGNSVSTD